MLATLTNSLGSLKSLLMVYLNQLFDYFPSLQRFPPAALADESQKIPLVLAEKTQINYNARRLRFRLPSENHVLGIAPGQHVNLSATINGKLVIRSYTPVSFCDELGFVDIIVKIYFRGVNPAFPEGGKMSQYLDELEVGQSVDFRGPAGGILYRNLGTFFFKKQNLERNYTKLSMIAGGSGLTPMLQIITTVLRNPFDNTRIRFIFANTEERDILCRKELDDLAFKSGGRLIIRFILTQPTTDWMDGRGRLDDLEIQKHLFPPSTQNLVMICGPPGMINEACKPNLEKLGYASDHIYVF